MKLSALFAYVLLAIVLGSTSARLLKPLTGLPFSLHAEGFPGDLIRVRILPNDGREFYEVTDVIVAEQVPDEQLEASCATPTDCEIKVGDSLVEVMIGMVPTGEPLVTLKHYTMSTKIKTMLTKVTIPVKDDVPEADFEFPQATHLYGIPEHAVDLSLQHDVEYRLMNLDVFHYKLDDPGGIYGSIPFLMAHSASQTTGLLFLNSADSKVKVTFTEEGKKPQAAWRPTVGLVDMVFIPGPTPAAVQKQHSSLTGPTFLPPLFSLGYHQCRWNYRHTNDCLDVDSNFDHHNIPYDVLWLDIEHTDGKKYFTWDLHNFKEPGQLLESISSKGRKMVTIVDPHVKREGGYHVHEEATSQGYYVKTEAGSDFEGHCWPGTSSWVDYYNEHARNWYSSLFKFDKHSWASPDLYTWIDMNEPSVFNAHEVTMDMNAVHHSATGKTVKHKYLHNMYGFYNSMAVFNGHVLRSKEHEPSQAKGVVNRPFILTRSFFAGSQRYVAMWTGDNMGKWDHLEKSLPMLLTLSISNFPFVGADVGGFFFDPPVELLTRWYQAAIFYPFLRAHAHLETKRREPWLFGEEVTNRVREAVSLRYTLLPYLYSLFYNAHAQGDTVIRPLFYEFPHEARLFDIQSTFMFGPAFLVSPITKEGQQEFTVPFPENAVWYDYYTGQKHGSGDETFFCNMDTIPLFMRGGFIVPTKQRLRRSSTAMATDPLTLYIAVNDQGNAAGSYFGDDGMSFNYQNGKFVHRDLTFSGNVLRSVAPLNTTSHPEHHADFNLEIERILIFGLDTHPTKAVAKFPDAASEDPTAVVPTHVLDVTGHGQHGAVVIRKPSVKVADNWEIVIE